MLEKTLESPLDCKEIQSVHPKGNKFRIFIGMTEFIGRTGVSALAFFMANRWGNNGNSESLYLFFWAPKSLQMVATAMKLKDAYSLEGKL